MQNWSLGRGLTRGEHLLPKCKDMSSNPLEKLGVATQAIVSCGSAVEDKQELHWSILSLTLAQVRWETLS